MLKVTMHLVVGSTNPVKVQAVKLVADSIWQDAAVRGIETESGVGAQPMTDEETKQGSINRARNALLQYYSSSESRATDVLKSVESKQGTTHQPVSGDVTRQNSKSSTSEFKNSKLEVTLGIGLEGGVFETKNGEMWNTVWVSVVDNMGAVVSASGARFLLPENVAAGIRAGEEMGEVVAKFTGVENIKHKEGFIGYMTNNVVDRTSEYSNLVRLAIGLWVGSQ